MAKKASMAMWEKVFVDPHGSGEETRVALEVERYEGVRGDTSAMLRLVLGPVEGDSEPVSGAFQVSGEMAKAVAGDSLWALLGERMEDC